LSRRFMGRLPLTRGAGSEARRKFCAAAEGPAARQSRQARAAITLGEASSLMFWRTHDGRGATPLVEALVAIIEASRAYLPPDGIGKDAFISGARGDRQFEDHRRARRSWSSGGGVRGHEGLAGVLRAARPDART
jgi:hypothetical protein